MDKTFFSNNFQYSTCFDETGLNANELILGSTGSGKTKSIVEPKLLHAEYDNYIVTLTKQDIIYLYKDYLLNKDYQVSILDLVHENESEYGFNPLEYLHTEKDYLWFANVILSVNGEEYFKNDKYWVDASISLLAAEITYIKSIYKEAANLKHLMDFHNKITLKEAGNLSITNFDNLFRDIAFSNPNSLAVRGWKQLSCNAIKTASCVLSTLNSCLDKVFTDHIIYLSTLKKRFHIGNLLHNKEVLFLLSSPVDTITQCYTNVLYSLLFYKLFHYAESLPNYKLPIATHFICDDFAVGNTIPDFDKYISIFRSTNISATILLQDEHQLSSLYGPIKANTIINNCDSIIYMGGMDIQSCQNISKRVNRPFSDIYKLKKNELIIIRRGEDPIFDTRYKILEDPYYIQLKNKQLYNIEEIESR